SNHLRAGIGLLAVVGDGDRVELALAALAPQDAGRILPGDRRTGLDLGPHHLRPGTAAVRALGNEVVDAAPAFLVAREPVLDRRVFHLRFIERDDLDYRRVVLLVVKLQRFAAPEL